MTDPTRIYPGYAYGAFADLRQEGTSSWLPFGRDAEGFPVGLPKKYRRSEYQMTQATMYHNRVRIRLTEYLNELATLYYDKQGGTPEYFDLLDLYSDDFFLAWFDDYMMGIVDIDKFSEYVQAEAVRRQDQIVYDEAIEAGLGSLEIDP